MTSPLTASEKASCLIMKFGGTSVGSADAIRQVGRIVDSNRSDWPSMVVVVSALSGVTNVLLETAARAARGDTKAGRETGKFLIDRHMAVAEALVTGERLEELRGETEQICREFQRLCEAIAVLGEATPRAMDAIGAIGERLSSRVVAESLNESICQAIAVEATELIVTDRRHQAAHPELGATREKVEAVLRPLLQRGLVPVVTGFVGATPEGVTTTLGRGGSDYSAAILAAVIPAHQAWIWTDVDGVMTADPRIVPGAQTIPHLSYRELGELAYFGAKVLHPMTIRPVVEAGIGLSIRNTFNPEHPGTELTSQDQSWTEVIKAVTSIKGQSLLTIEGRGMLGVPGVAGRAFGAVANTGTNVILISQASSEQSICFTVSSNKAQEVIAALESVFSAELSKRDIDRIWNLDDVVIVTVVGSGMRHIPGVAGRVFSALGRESVNVIAIAQGSSEVAISLVVAEKDAEVAVRALHDLIGDQVGVGGK